MLNLPKRKLKKEMLVIRNPSERTLVVWLEPWADRFELRRRTRWTLYSLARRQAGRRFCRTQTKHPCTAGKAQKLSRFTTGGSRHVNRQLTKSFGRSLK